MDRIESYKEVGDQYILEQYKNSSRLRGVIDALLAQCDDLEAAFFEILGSIDLQTAIGPALDYLGEIVGVIRKPGETDEAYRTRIYQYRDLQGAPTHEGLRAALQLLTGQTGIGLYPNWPAELYWVPPQAEEYELSQLIAESVTSGVSLVQGTFLTCEDGEPYGLIVLEDNGQPIVVDQRWPDTEYAMVDSDGYIIVDEEGAAVVGIDYLTSQESVEID
jgi:hypothetical protein